MVWLPSMFEEGEGWPRDALNAAIATTLICSILPVGAIVILFELTGWNEAFPRWLALAPFIYLTIIGWIVLDELRGRRRSEADDGHGGIWQMVQAVGPRRRVNQAAIVVVLLAHFVGAVLVYVDRFAARDLERADATRVIEAVVIVAADVWLLVLVAAWIRSKGPEASYWPAVRFSMLCLVILNPLMSVGDDPWPWIILPTLVALLIAVPGWLLHAIWRWRHRTGSIYAIDSDPEPAGLPGWW